RIPVVSQADIDALTQAATKDLQARAEQEFKSKIPSGSKLVPNSMQKGKVNLTFNHKAGEDAEQVAVHGTIEVKGQVFDPAKLHAQARDEAGRRLAAQAGPGVIILSDRLKIGEPSPANDAQTAFTIRADAVVRSVISDEERRTLAARLVGKDMQDAEQILAGVPNAARHSIRLEPTWLPKRMPQLASHVRVVVSSDEQPSAP
ncbi:MAG: hypothetical protein IRY97_09435, partial [Thermomicrobiaceae bacterium]|nr:hypothetical protein [Thermomicrobiaceae bacterium]